MSYVSRNGWYSLALIALCALVVDQVSKYIVERSITVGTLPITVIPGLVNLVHTSNPGVAFGLGADSTAPWMAPVLILFSVAVIGLLIWLLVTNRAGGWYGQCGLALILGGAAGNVLDRVLRHSVTDFIDFYIGRHHWYTFNLADSAIVIGAGLVVLELFRDWRHPTQERA
ncbi:MAG TPA: signal peptidase II [Candidatus Limnocylindrales bacterium]|nr:signal peptidase II [Candidatus Limnocylindrales bacterium]